MRGNPRLTEPGMALVRPNEALQRQEAPSHCRQLTAECYSSNLLC